MALDRRLLAEATRPRAGRTGVLRVSELTGTVLVLGRYHVAPPPVAAAGVGLIRRVSGGRVAPGGEGFIGVTLVLPQRAALVAADPSALSPDQVMNRYVRGILAGLQAAGVNAYYPGRDLVTVEGRIIGLVSFEVDAAGACLFEAVVAVGRDFAILPALLDAVDPGGVVPAAMLNPGDVTSMRQETGRSFTTEELAALLRRGYEERLGVTFAEHAVAMPAVSDDAAWLDQRRPGPRLARHASVRGQIGVVEAFVDVDAGRLREVVLAGDFIASSATIGALEQALRGCAAERAAIDAVVQRHFAAPEHFVLGAGPIGTLTDAIAGAVET